MSQLSAPHSRVRSKMSLSGILAVLIAAIFVLAFGVMAQIRSQQEDEAKSYPSGVSVLAENRSSPGPLAESQQRGFAVFSHYCIICHGDEGRGDGFNSTRLARPPRDFSNAEFWKQTTDERVHFAIELRRTIRWQVRADACLGTNALRNTSRRCRRLPENSRSTG